MTAIVKGSIWRRKRDEDGDWLLFAIWPTGEVTLLANPAADVTSGTLVIPAEKLEAEWRCVRLS